MFSSQCVHDGRSVNPHTLSRALDRHPLQVFYSLPYMKVEHDVLFLLSGVSRSSQYTYAIQCTYYIARNNIYTLCIVYPEKPCSSVSRLSSSFIPRKTDCAHLSGRPKRRSRLSASSRSKGHFCFSRVY